MYQPEDIFATEVPPSNVIGCGQFSQLHKFAQFQNATCVQDTDESSVAACGQLENVPSRQHIPWYEERRRRSGLWVADELRHALRSCASSAGGGSVNCYSVSKDCGAKSFQPTIGVGKLNAIFVDEAYDGRMRITGPVTSVVW
jgi:hypothetical protein